MSESEKMEKFQITHESHWNNYDAKLIYIFVNIGEKFDMNISLYEIYTNI